MIIWLVVSNIFGCSIIPIDELIFFKMVIAPATSKYWMFH